MPGVWFGLVSRGQAPSATVACRVTVPTLNGDSRPRWGEAERAAFLASIRLFAALPPTILTQIARHFRPRYLQCGEVVFLKGLPATELNLLTTGRITVVRETADG